MSYKTQIFRAIRDWSAGSHIKELYDPHISGKLEIGVQGPGWDKWLYNPPLNKLPK